jgi:cytoskeletal protein RodZ
MTETIGQRLKRARKYRLLTLEKASEATRIRVPYLQALEADDYSVIPSAAQGRGFLRNYAEYLDVNLDEILAEMQASQPGMTDVSGPLPQADVDRGEPPPLEEKPRPFWTRLLARAPRVESMPEVESPELPQQSVAETEPTQPEPLQGTETSVSQPDPVKARGRKKKETAIPETPRKGRRKKSQAEESSIVAGEQPVVPAVEEIEAVAESLSGEAAQAEDQPAAPTGEARPSLLTRLKSFIPVRRAEFHPKDSVAEDATGDVEPRHSVQASPVSDETAEEIFTAIGSGLRERRELISLTFDEVERHTHVRAAFLKFLEEGAFDKLPSPVQTRGMLANYASFLDLDVDAILYRFADALQARHRKKYPDMPRSKSLMTLTPTMPPFRSFIAGDLIFGVAMIVILAGLAVWGVGRMVTTQQSEAAALSTAPSISDVLAGTLAPVPAQAVTFIAVEDTPLAVTGAQETTAEAPTLGANVNVVVMVSAVERSYLRVSVDGEVKFDGRVAPGDVFTYEAENQVSILTGNGAALRITYNGRDLGLMGNFGQVASQIYTLAGLATPTATVSPTPTVTPRESPTPTWTETPTPGLATETPTP